MCLHPSVRNHTLTDSTTGADSAFLIARLYLCSKAICQARGMPRAFQLPTAAGVRPKAFARFVAVPASEIAIFSKSIHALYTTVCVVVY